MACRMETASGKHPIVVYVCVRYLSNSDRDCDYDIGDCDRDYDRDFDRDYGITFTVMVYSF
jgi:hypothetical protein